MDASVPGVVFSHFHCHQSLNSFFTMNFTYIFHCPISIGSNGRKVFEIIGADRVRIAETVFLCISCDYSFYIIAVVSQQPKTQLTAALDWWQGEFSERQ